MERNIMPKNYKKWIVGLIFMYFCYFGAFFLNLINSKQLKQLFPHVLFSTAYVAGILLKNSFNKNK